MGLRLSGSSQGAVMNAWILSFLELTTMATRHVYHDLHGRM